MGEMLDFDMSAGENIGDFLIEGVEQPVLREVERLARGLVQ